MRRADLAEEDKPSGDVVGKIQPELAWTVHTWSMLRGTHVSNGAMLREPWVCDQ